LMAWVGLKSGPWVWVTYGGIIAFVLLVPMLLGLRAARTGRSGAAVPVAAVSRS
jgi:hypothetical protein